MLYNLYQESKPEEGFILRIRNKPWIPEAIKEYSDLIIDDPVRYRGNWREIFGHDGPVHMELGTGKGKFITALARMNPEIGYLGLEVQQQVIYYAARRVREEALANVRLINKDARNLGEYFCPGEIDRIYLNFCDPWPKKRHAKRRLTHRNFLESYKEILKPGGLICFKTDNSPLFEFSLEEMTAAGFILKRVTRDLHSLEANPSPALTEYEEKFIARGIKINYCEAEAPGRG